MANTPKKMKDPTEAALSAIQDALHVGSGDEPAGPVPAPPITAIADESMSEPAWPGLRSSRSRQEDQRDEEPLRSDDAGALRRPANDDRESIGQILRALQRR